MPPLTRLLSPQKVIIAGVIEIKGGEGLRGRAQTISTVVWRRRGRGEGGGEGGAFSREGVILTNRMQVILASEAAPPAKQVLLLLLFW